MSRVLACMPHFFRRAAANSQQNHGSNLSTLEERSAQFSYCLRQLVANLEQTQFLMGSPGNVGLDQVSVAPKAISGDVVVVSTPEDNLLAEVSNGIIVENRVWGGPPRLLGYQCRRVFADRVGQYDFYCFVEDDTAIIDSAFFRKIATFHALFGEDKILLPNRYEIMGVKEAAWRAYLDIPAFPFHRTPERPGPTRLEAPAFGRSVYFDKTTDGMSGCYVITDAQLRRWMTQPDFHEPDPELVAAGQDPLELTQVPLGGALALYRPAPENIGFLEVHHVPNRLSKTPGPYPKAYKILDPILRARLEQRARRELEPPSRAPRVQAEP